MNISRSHRIAETIILSLMTTCASCGPSTPCAENPAACESSGADGGAPKTIAVGTEYRWIAPESPSTLTDALSVL